MTRGQIIVIAVAVVLLLIIYDKQTNASTGLGDSVANLAAALGIDKTPECGCQARQTVLNNLLPYQ
jgi:hypothetical protein